MQIPQENQLKKLYLTVPTSLFNRIKEERDIANIDSIVTYLLESYYYNKELDREEVEQ